MKVWELTSDKGINALVLNDRARPEPGAGQVIVKVGASSINYRDLATIEDPIPRNIKFPMIPNSDCAGEVLAIGAGVKNVSVGDEVIGCFFQEWVEGPISPAVMSSALGGALEGVLAEQVILNADAVVAVPEHLNIEEASTLPVAALTAWHALTLPDPITPNDTVLILGTGGVSVFAQQFCSSIGANTIVTSSSDEKLKKMKDLGAQQTINYTSSPDWDKEVLDMTNGKGADRVIEVGGAGTLQKSLTAVRVGGQIQLIGILSGAAGSIVPTDIMRKSVSVRGIYDGSRAMFEDMNAFLSKHKIHPVIDSVYDFEDAKSAYQKMRDATHLGKLVIRVSM